MKCPEVIEWMHRYLDNDLNEENTTEMMEHIAHCPQCAESFRMLKSLSHELAELPLVNPKYSLVDAIMPQLDAIDRARLEKCASKERAPDEMVPVTPVIVPKRRLFAGTAARTVIGAVAAMGILGVAIYAYTPQEIDDAQMQEPVAKVSDKVASAQQKTVDNTATNNAGISVAATDTAQQDGISSDSVASSDMEQRTPDQTVENEGDVPVKVDKPSELAVAPKSPDPSSTKAPDDTAKQTKEDPLQSSQGASDKSSAQDKSRTVEPVQGKASSSNKEVTVPKDKSISEAPKALTVDPPIPSQDSLMTQIRAFGLDTSQSWESPDGKMQATLEDQKLVIYKLPLEMEIKNSIIQSIELTGDWVSGEWSEDSKVFTYQTSLDGKVSSYTYPNDTAVAP
ncbi:hypothetical protein PMSD_19700 [Paenibacillus macquariensis subsp. defensor]|nr:hypothetical protein PMSD_19700 [Paenibacillus macquariensis subsp. defensor]